MIAFAELPLGLNTELLITERSVMPPTPLNWFSRAVASIPVVSMTRSGETIVSVPDWLKAPFDFQRRDPIMHSFNLVLDEGKRREIGKRVSPVYHVSMDSAPALIVHGDADKLVPIQQAQIIIAKFKEVGVPAELITKKGAAHGWKDLPKDLASFADWFDRHLKKSQ